MTPQEFANRTDIRHFSINERGYRGTLYALGRHEDRHDIAWRIDCALPPADAANDALVVVVNPEEWDAAVPDGISGVWEPNTPLEFADDDQFLVVTRVEDRCRPYTSRPEYTTLYAAATHVFASLPPAGYWAGDIVAQVAALRAWRSNWDGNPFSGPRWAVDDGGRWTLTSESSGRQFLLSPDMFAIDFGASIVAAAEVAERLAPALGNSRTIAFTVALGRLADDGGTDVVPDSEMRWPGTLRQLVAALAQSSARRDALRDDEPEP